jgi:hypothetical protein
MDAIFPRFITTGRHYAPLAAAYDQRLSLQCRMVQAFNGDEECIQVKVRYDTLVTGHLIHKLVKNRTGQW